MPTYRATFAYREIVEHQRVCTVEAANATEAEAQAIQKERNGEIEYIEVDGEFYDEYAPVVEENMNLHDFIEGIAVIMGCVIATAIALLF